MTRTGLGRPSARTDRKPPVEARRHPLFLGGWTFRFTRADGATLDCAWSDPLITDLAGVLAGVKPAAYFHAESARLPELERLARFFSLDLLVTDRAKSPLPLEAGRVEAFLAREPGVLRRAEALWAEGGASGDSEGFASILGYPKCCYEWFRETSPDGAVDVVESIRSRSGPGPYPFQLNNLFNFTARDVPFAEPLQRFHVVPWHPCRYDCRATAEAGAAIWSFVEELLPEFAGLAAGLLAKPVLYLGEAGFAVLDGAVRGGACRYSRVLDSGLLAGDEADRLLRSGDRATLGPEGVRIASGRRQLGEIPCGRARLLAFR